jgi:hypothetical protein
MYSNKVSKADKYYNAKGPNNILSFDVSERRNHTDISWKESDLLERISFMM